MINALEKPQQILQGSKGRKTAHKVFKREGKEFLLRVIFSEEDDRKKVIMVYSTSKIGKYWRSNK